MAALLLAAGVLFPTAAAGTDLLPAVRLVACPPGVIEVGAPGSEAFLGSGFHAIENTFAWTSGRARMELPLARGGPLKLRLTGRAVAEGQRLELRWNGRGLGRQEIPVRWHQLEWEVPETRPGFNLLELVPARSHRAPPDPRPLAVAVQRLELEGSSCPEGSAPLAVFGAEGAHLVDGATLLAPALLLPGGRLAVAVTGEPGARLLLFGWSGTKQRPLGEVEVGAEGHGAAELSFAECCSGLGGIAGVVSGPGPLSLTRLEVLGEASGWAWRRACRLPAVQVGLLLLLGGVLVGARRAAGRLPLEGASWAPWVDALLVALVALAIRWWFLQHYPDPGNASDAYEYLLRARRLAAGHVSFLHDPSWHAWQTWIRPPGFYLFLAWVHGPLGGTVQTVIQLHALLSALAAGATTWLGARLFGRAAGLLAGLWLAFWVESMVTFSTVLSEPLYMALVVPGLAALTAASARPSWRLAALAGLAFGLASLVRSAPVHYVPLAALLLLVIHGGRRGWRPAAALVGGLLVAIVPWSVRNSVIYGHPMGIDDIAVANLLQYWPNDRFIPVADLDLETERGRRIYYDRLQMWNKDRGLTRQGGAVMRATLTEMASQPGRTAVRFAHHLRLGFRPVRDEGVFAWVHRDSGRCRDAFVTDAMNFQLYSLLLLAAVGVALSWRDHRTWPLLLWFLFNTVVINLVFMPQNNYRLPTLPVLMVLAGLATSRLLGLEPRRGDPPGGGP